MDDHLPRLAIELLGASARGSILLAGSLALVWCLRRMSASHQHLVLSLCLFAFLLLPVVPQIPGGWGIGQIPVQPWNAVPEGIGTWEAAEALGSLGSSTAQMYAHAAVVVWFLGCAMLLLRFGIGMVLVIGRFRRARPVADPQWDALAHTIRQRQRMRRSVRLLIEPRATAPVAWGLIRPGILLPAVAREWSPEQRRIVLVHELAHLRRWDSLIHVTMEIARAVHWYNPLVWLVARKLRLTSERASDDAVLEDGTAPSNYAAQLVHLARTVENARVLAAAHGLVSRTTLELRIQCILDPAMLRKRPGRRARLALTGVISGLVVLSAELELVAAPAEKMANPEVLLYASEYGISAELAQLIATTAAAEQLDPDLAFGLVRAESGFRNDNPGTARGVGLTRLLPGTAAGLQPGISTDQLLDPETNLRLGFRLLRRYLDRYDGRVTEALLAYHLGPAQLARLRTSTTQPVTDYPQRVLGTRSRL